MIKRLHDSSGVAGAASAAIDMYLVSDSSATSSASLVIQFANASGVATDPASGEISDLQFSFRNSSAF